MNLNENGDSLDGQGFAPFAMLANPTAALAALNACAEVKGVDQNAAKEHGAKYFEKFPQLSKWTDTIIE